MRERRQHDQPADDSPTGAVSEHTVEQLLERVRALPAVSEALIESPLDASDLQLDHHLIDELRLDSIQLLSLAVAVENEFQVAFSEEDDEQITTVKELLTRVAVMLEAG